MVKDKDIKKFMLQHKPVVKNSDAFMKDVVRQMDSLPVPSAMDPKHQKEDCIRIVLEVSRKDLRSVRLAVSVIAIVVILSAITISMIPSEFIPSIPTELFHIQLPGR